MKKLLLFTFTFLTFSTVRASLACFPADQHQTSSMPIRIAAAGLAITCVPAIIVADFCYSRAREISRESFTKALTHAHKPELEKKFLQKGRKFNWTATVFLAGESLLAVAAYKSTCIALGYES